MDYSELLRAAWRITWRHKYLWILGFFAAEGGGCSFSGSPPGGSFGNYSANGPTGAEDWFASNWVLLVALGFGLLVLGLAMWVISVITTGGLISGTDAAHGGRPDAGLGPAWRAGVHSFWRLLGMWLLVGLAVFLVILLLLLIIALPIGLSLSRGADFGAGTIVLIVLFVILLVVIAIPVGVIMQIALTWASRSLVLEGTGVIDSLRSGWRLFRSNVGTSLLVWLIGVGVSIGMGVALLVPLAIVGIPIGLVGYRLLTDGGGAMWGVLGILGVIALVAFGFYKAVSTTYLGAYWTVAYRNLATAGGPPGYVSVRQLMETSQAPWTAAPPTPPAALSPPSPSQAPTGPVRTNAPPTPPAPWAEPGQEPPSKN
ncbi:MAG: DUF7544 domain-containing protein [Thermoleophilia bacterium]